MPGTHARLELDAWADTSCAGMDFRLYELTGQTCNIMPFSDQYSPMNDVPIATCLTAYTNAPGITDILVFHEMLWFGTSMDHFTGTPVSDDPFDTSCVLVISHEDVLIPFQTDGTAVFFDTHVPTDVEVENYTHIVMTHDSEWDPLSVWLSQVRTKEEESFRLIQATYISPAVQMSKVDQTRQYLTHVH